MSDTVTVYRNSTVHLRFTIWEGAAGESTRRDLSDVTLFNGSPSVTYPDPLLEITDAVNGEVSVTWTDEQTEHLAPGRIHMFRLGLDYPDGEGEVLPEIWLDVK